jgi:sporulation protein YlmC with PRC-barrel domain
MFDSSIDIRKLSSALIIDSAGCIVGRGAEISSSEEDAEFKIYDVIIEEENVLDSEKLKKLLVKYFSERARERAEGFLEKIMLARITIKDVYEIIRSQTGIYDIDDNVLASYAERIGLQVPFEKKTRESRIHKLTLKLDMIESMNETDLGTCILLREPVEARIRNIDLSEEKPIKFNALNELYGKLVVDRKARILGNVSEVLIGIRGYSFRISKKIGEKEIKYVFIVPSDKVKAVNDIVLLNAGVEELISTKSM